jgi:hypothetical protein
VGWLVPSKDPEVRRLEEDMFSGFMLALAVGAAVSLMMPMLQGLSQATVSAQQMVPVYTTPPDTVAANEGFLYLINSGLGQPSQLRMIAENSAGAFEEVLVSLTT